MTRKKKGSAQSQTASIGSLTEDLKRAFGARSIPLETDFGNMIDVADCGRRAIGLSPDYTPVADSGLILDDNGQLYVVPDESAGARVRPTGLGLALDTTRGITSSSAGVGVILDVNPGLETSADGLGVMVNPVGGLTVDSSGIAMDGLVRSAPVGTIAMWPFANIPAGWLLCNGAQFNSATYPTLAAVLGSNVLPNFTGRYPCGVDDYFPEVNGFIEGRTGIPDGFSIDNRTSADGQHSHEYQRVDSNYFSTSAGSEDYGYLNYTWLDPKPTTSAAGGHNHVIEVFHTFNSDQTRPAGISLHFIIACD